MDATIKTFVIWAGSLLFGAGAYYVAAFILVIIGLPILLAIRQVWRWISPYEEPEWGGVPSLRDRLERL